MISFYRLKSDDVNLLTDLKYDLSKTNDIKLSNKIYNQIEKDRKYLAKKENIYILLEEGDKKIGYIKLVEDKNSLSLEELFILDKTYKNLVDRYILRFIKDYLLKNPFNKFLDLIDKLNYTFEDISDFILDDYKKRYAIISYRADDDFKDLLKKDGYTLIKSYPNKNLADPINDHPDLQVFKVNDDTLICDKNLYLYYRAILPPRINLLTTDLDIFSKYPHDCRLNCFLSSDYLFANPRAVDPLVLRETGDKKLVAIKQGYAKCSTILISCDTIITSDMGIYKKSLQRGLDAYLIEKGEIKLPGYDYGFIGGTCGYNGKSLYFYGNLDKYKYKDRLIEILDKVKITYKYPRLSDFRDLGSMIFI